MNLTVHENLEKGTENGTYTTASVLVPRRDTHPAPASRRPRRSHGQQQEGGRMKCALYKTQDCIGTEDCHACYDKLTDMEN